MATAIIAFTAYNFGAWTTEAAEFEQRAGGRRSRAIHAFTGIVVYLAGLVLTVLTLWFALTTVIQGWANLRISTSYCFAGDEAHRKDAAGAQIKLFRSHFNLDLS